MSQNNFTKAQYYLENALQAMYPVTTGLLLGLTSTAEEVVGDITNLILLIQNNKAIQEVILQNFRAKKNTIMKNNSEMFINYTHCFINYLLL